jgi:beta-N-acetylhexosaminidase
MRVKAWRVILVLAILWLNLGAFQARNAAAADQDYSAAAEAFLQDMTPEEKVGQLFLVTFEGNAVDAESQIYDLITNQHVGGVVLLAENNNFGSENVLSQTRTLVETLQGYEWASASEEFRNDDTGDYFSPAYVPLFIGISQPGNGAPRDQILEGLTQLPSQMAVGATWNLDFANQMGQVLGDELSALGFNLYLGPNLDVLETENAEATNSLGVQTFGGDPFWVGEMGKAFISGLHTGSENRMLVVAQNFPGSGNSDRSPEDEVATVRKSLEQLKQIELAPFFAVTNLEVGNPSRVDALMVSHIRYQGFQGNIRATTKPVSFDSNALQQIMALEAFAAWREDGGLIISDSLGSRAVRRFFDPTETNFEAWQVARNAFLAGNDMLYVNNFIATGDPNAYTTLLHTLEFFTQKYREDSAFAKRVDASVLRILAAKLAVFGGEFDVNAVLPEEDLGEIGQAQEVTFDVAQNAVTLVSPNALELDLVLPSPPLWYEDILIFSDVRTVSQCDTCPPVNPLKTNELANALLRLYGPQAGGQILQSRLASYTFSQLVEVLDNVEDSAAPYLLENLRAADWVVFNCLDVNAEYPDSNALQRIFAERPDLLSGKRVVVFALDSPVYLDATNISKTMAYYALYSKVPEFIDVAARVLMQEIDPPGSLPVSLNAVGYDLIFMTSPDPDQVIPLELVLSEPEQPELEATPGLTVTPEPTPMPSFSVGDTITIRTGTIYDHNHHVVPDGTVVRFNFRISGEPGVTQQFETTTEAGIAYFNYRIEAAGTLDVSAVSEPATQSETLRINIEPDGETNVIAISPTPQSTATPTATLSPTPTEQPLPTPTQEPAHSGFPTLGEWALGTLVIGLGGGLAYLIGRLWWGSSGWGLRSLFCTVIGGLLFYTYLNVGIPDTQYWMVKSGTVFVVEMVVAGMLIGWIAGLVWWMTTAGRYPSHRRK